jgi:PKD repeat protein
MSSIVWSIESGSLPEGLKLTEDHWYDGDSYRYSISGRPTTEGTYTFKLKATNAAGSDTKEFTITIEPPIPQEIIATEEMEDGKVGYHYEQRLEIIGSVDELSVVGNLPEGLGLGKAYYYGYYHISGIPTKAGTYNFSLKAANAQGYDEKNYTMKIELELPGIAISSMPNGVVGKSYGQSLGTSMSSIVWSIESGSLPEGLKLTEDHWYDYRYSISGTPTTEGTYTFKLKATNAAGSDTKEFTIKIAMPKPPLITTETLPNFAMSDDYYSKELTTSAEYAQWSLESGNLPPGFTLSSGGNISYYGYSITTAGTYTFTVKAENASGSDKKEFTIIVSEALLEPVIITKTLPEGTVGEEYLQQLEATWHAEWSLESGNLPNGLDIIEDFQYDYYSYSIYGKPTTAGTYTFTVKAANEAGSDKKEFTIKINAAKTPQEMCTDAGNIWIDEQCKTAAQIAQEICVADGGAWENGACKTTPIRLSQIAGMNILAQATGKAILLQNLPSNAKVEAYNLQGKQIYFGNSGNSQTLQIAVRTKGMYIVKVNREVLKVHCIKD